MVTAAHHGIASATAVWRFTRPEPVTVSLYRVTRGPVASPVANTRVGTVKACRRSNVVPATGGQVARLNVAEGSHVKKDQILLEIWNDDLRAELALAEADRQSRPDYRQGGSTTA